VTHASADMMKSFNQLNRRLFWMWTIPIIAAHVLLSIAVADGMGVGAFDTVLIVLLAAVVAGRFRDIGWPAWLGPAFVLVTMLGIPAVAMGVMIAQKVDPDQFVQSLLRIGQFAGLANLVLLVIAGSMPGKAVAAEPG
jgi:hypothetical protein